MLETDLLFSWHVGVVNAFHGGPRRQPDHITNRGTKKRAHAARSVPLIIDSSLRRRIQPPLFFGSQAKAPQEFTALEGVSNLSNNAMKYMIHDFSVWRWGRATKHTHFSQSRIDIQWPLQVRRLLPLSNESWLVGFYKPSIHLLNSYEMERDYMIARSLRDRIQTSETSK